MTGRRFALLVLRFSFYNSTELHTSAYMLRKAAGGVTSADGERGGLSGLGMMGNDVLHRMGAKNRAPKAPRGAERCPRCETSNRSESFVNVSDHTGSRQHTAPLSIAL